MNLFRVCIALLAPGVLWLSACGRGPDFVANDEPWRADEERACLQMGVVRETRSSRRARRSAAPARAGR